MKVKQLSLSLSVSLAPPILIYTYTHIFVLSHCQKWSEKHCT